MNLGTVEQTIGLLRENGYNEWLGEELLESIRYEDLPGTLLDSYHFGEDRLHIQWNFDREPDGTTTHDPLTISFLRVPMAHQTVAGIDTAELENRMKAVDWTIDYQDIPDLFLAAFKDRIAAVEGICNDLAKLGQSNTATGELLAKQLTVKYWSWQPPNDYSMQLEENKSDYVVAKTYDELPVIDEAYQALANLWEQQYIQQQNKFLFTHNSKEMNRNNLESLKDEMKALGFNEKLTAEMEKNMQHNVPAFTLYDSQAASRGMIGTTLYFKQSTQSEHYYFNKFQVALDKGGKLLEGDNRYLVISPAEGKNPFRAFKDPHEAITYFKEQKGKSELAVGKDPAHKTMLATMENGKVDYVVKDFQSVYNNPAITQTFYVENGNGFTAQQAANLIQGRAVYREDLANAAGNTYQAWVILDLKNAKDRHGNFFSKHYHDPSYGFNMPAVLDKFQIRELEDTAKREKLEAGLREGNRPLVTTVKDGQETRLYLEASPRFSQLNFFQENGKPEKREQFLKEQPKDQSLNLDKGKLKEKEQEQGMSV